ncbi:hypothetical protein RUM43_011031 [Polyplax serrata]|uniref:Uncharacterized protein n=1 Tax=Polyplax serrata TaxID=468196 RepID=A0AAN8P602_POLSC
MIRTRESDKPIVTFRGRHFRGSREKRNDLEKSCIVTLDDGVIAINQGLEKFDTSSIIGSITVIQRQSLDS